MKKKRELSQEDKKTWEKYIKDPKDIFDKERNNSNQKLEKNRYKFDLHGFTLEAANLKVKGLKTIANLHLTDSPGSAKEKYKRRVLSPSNKYNSQKNILNMNLK